MVASVRTFGDSKAPCRGGDQPSLVIERGGQEAHHGGQTALTITSMHGKFRAAQRILMSLASFLGKVRVTAEQLSWERRWWLILIRIFRWFLKGKPLK